MSYNVSFNRLHLVAKNLMMDYVAPGLKCNDFFVAPALTIWEISVEKVLKLK